MRTPDAFARVVSTFTAESDLPVHLGGLERNRSVGEVDLLDGGDHALPSEHLLGTKVPETSRKRGLDDLGLGGHVVLLSHFNKTAPTLAFKVVLSSKISKIKDPITNRVLF